MPIKIIEKSMDSQGAVISTYSRSDIVNIESPEQIRIPYRIASPFSRLLALIADISIIYFTLFLIVVLLLIFNLIHISGESNPIKTLSEGSFLSSMSIFFIMILDFILQWFYFIFFETFLNGRTPGKLLFGLRVINYYGKPLDATSIILRNFIRVFDQQYSLYLGAFFCIILNRDFRRIGDLAAETIVINEEKESFKFPDFALLTRGGIHNEKFLSKKLGEDDLYVIRNFINSLNTISLEKQHELSDKLAKKIKEKLQDDEDYTDSLLYLQKIYDSHKDY